MAITKKNQPILNILNDIVDVTIALHKIFTNLGNSFEEDEITYKKNLDYLKMTLEYENKLYNQLEEYNDFSPTITASIFERKKIPLSLYKNIKKRINFYLSLKEDKYPFFYTEYTRDLNELKNLICIQKYCTEEFVFNKLYYYIEQLNNTTDKTERKILYKQYLNTLFTYKIYTNCIFQPITTIHTNGRNKLALFNHDPQNIENIYREFILQIINYSISSCQAIEISHIKNKQAYFDNELVQLRSALSLLTADEQEDIYDGFVNNENILDFIKTTPKAYSSIKDTIEQFITLQNKNLSKK